MHSGSLDTSPRLQRVHELLSDGREYSTRDIREGAHIEAVSATVAELRDNGAEIECRQSVSGTGSRIWLYRMTKPAPGAHSGSGTPNRARRPSDPGAEAARASNPPQRASQPPPFSDGPGSSNGESRGASSQTLTHRAGSNPAPAPDPEPRPLSLF